jgi:hypothetical protein
MRAEARLRRVSASAGRVVGCRPSTIDSTISGARKAKRIKRPTTPPVVTPVAGTDGQEAFVFSYNFDTDAPKIFATTRRYPKSSTDFMTGTPSGPSPDLFPFSSHGGKMIMYDSVNDGIFSAVDLINYYNMVDQVMGGHAQDFARLFMIPNMAHCVGGPATDSFSAKVLTAITNWVEDDEWLLEQGGLETSVSREVFPKENTRECWDISCRNRHRG